MDLGAPYRSVIPSLDGPVLAVLERTTRPLTGREIARLSRAGSVAGVRKVLARLEAQGLVEVAESGPSLMYVANRRHIAWPAVELLMTVRHRLRGLMVESIRGWDPQPELVGLYGSAARGDGGLESDVDLLVVRPDRVADVHAGPDEEAARWADQLARLRDDVRAGTGNPVHILELSSTELSSRVVEREPIVDEWRRDLDVLAGRPVWAGTTRTADGAR